MQAEVLARVRVRSLGFVGIDACSPREVRLALDHGWTAEEIQPPGRTCLTETSTRPFDRRPHQRRPAVPARSVRSPGARVDGRDPREPAGRGRHAQGWPGCTPGAIGRRSSGSSTSSSTMPSISHGRTISRSTRFTFTSARVCSPTPYRRSRWPSAAGLMTERLVAAGHPMSGRHGGFRRPVRRAGEPLDVKAYADV